MSEAAANPYAPILALGTVLPLVLSAYGWRQRRLLAGGTAFAVFNLGVAIWTGVYMVELGATGGSAVFWANMAYLGILLVPASWLVFALRYSGHGDQVSTRFLRLLGIEPAVTLVLAWTNPWHHLFRKSLQVTPSWEPGPAFWVHTAYSYALVFAGTVLVAHRALTGPRLGRGQAGVLLVGALAPWTANAIYLGGLSPFGNLDLSPFGFGLTSLAAAWVLFRDLEQRLVAAEGRFRALIDHTIDAIEVIDPETGRFLDVNQRACLARGYTREEYLRLSAPEIDSHLPQRSWEGTRDEARRLGSYVFESEHRRKDGSVFPVEVNATFVSLDRDYVLAVVRDITDRKRAEAKFRGLLESAPDAMVIADERGVVTLVNAQTENLFGYPRGDLLGRPMDALLPERFRSPRPDGGVHREPGPRPWPFEAATELFGLRKNGAEFPVEINLSPLQSEEGPLVSAAIRDITRRRQIEQGLVESHNLLSAVVEGTTDAVYVKDILGRYLMLNAAGARMLSSTVEKAIGRDDRALFGEATGGAIMEADRRVMTRGEPEMVEQIVSAAGVSRAYNATKDVYLDEHGRVIGLIGVARDVTDLKRLEEQLRRAQKMEAVGRLASGVAHDFNNILGVVIGYGEVVLRSLVSDDPLRSKVEEILKAAERAAALTRQLLAFGRQQVLQPKALDLNVVVAEMDAMLRRLVGDDVVLVTIPGPALGTVEGDPGQLQQVIMNLAVNARDAMPDGGRLTIETSNVDVDAQHAARYPPLKAGLYVKLAITDTGAGIDTSTRGHVFEPFFTTKEFGKGAGLGLSTVYGIVEQSGGHVFVDSEVGAGTSFTIYLPRTAKPGGVS